MIKKRSIWAYYGWWRKQLTWAKEDFLSEGPSSRSTPGSYMSRSRGLDHQRYRFALTLVNHTLHRRRHEKNWKCISSWTWLQHLTKNQEEDLNLRPNSISKVELRAAIEGWGCTKFVLYVVVMKSEVDCWVLQIVVLSMMKSEENLLRTFPVNSEWRRWLWVLVDERWGWGLVLRGLKVEEDEVSNDRRWREDGRKTRELSESWRYEFIDSQSLSLLLLLWKSVRSCEFLLRKLLGFVESVGKFC